MRMSDRSNNNWLGVAPPGEEPALKLIDHGHALTGQGGVGSSLVDKAQVGSRLADDTVMALERLSEAAVDASLGELISEAVVADVVGRAGALARARELTLPDNPGV